MAVSIRMVVTKASELDPVFRRKGKETKERCVRRFVKSHQLVYRVHTHESQRPPQEVEDEALYFLGMMQPMVREANRSEDYIINMDQTPVFFMLPQNTLEPMGNQTVNVRTCTSSTIRVTVAVIVTSSGRTLPPLIFLKKSLMVVLKESFENYPEGGKYSV